MGSFTSPVKPIFDHDFSELICSSFYSKRPSLQDHKCVGLTLVCHIPMCDICHRNGFLRHFTWHGSVKQYRSSRFDARGLWYCEWASGDHSVQVMENTVGRWDVSILFGENSCWLWSRLLSTDAANDCPSFVLTPSWPMTHRRKWFPRKEVSTGLNIVDI